MSNEVVTGTRAIVEYVYFDVNGVESITIEGDCAQDCALAFKDTFPNAEVISIQLTHEDIFEVQG
jgi:hypothetical protein